MQIGPYELLIVGIICLCLVGVIAAIAVGIFLLVRSPRKKESDTGGRDGSGVVVNGEVLRSVDEPGAGGGAGGDGGSIQ
jgi:hypothetical protein